MDGVDTPIMVTMSHHFSAYSHFSPDVKDDGFCRVCEDGGQIVGVLLVPAQPHERREIVRLVDDGGVLE